MIYVNEWGLSILFSRELDDKFILDLKASGERRGNKKMVQSEIIQ